MLCPGPEVPCWIFDKMHKFSRSFAVYHVALAFLCCHHIDSYITYMTISFNTVNAYVYSHIFNESRWSLEHKHFLRGIHSPTLLLGGGGGAACIPPPPLDPSALLVVALLLFLPIMFTPRIMSERGWLTLEVKGHR